MAEVILASLATDTTLDKRYRIVSVLGQGGFAITYRAYDANLDVDVVIKEYMPSDTATRDIDGATVSSKMSNDSGYRYGLDRFVDEARKLARFEHPHIVRINNYFEANGTAYIVMPFIQGQTLSEWHAKQETISQQQVVAVIRPLLQGLSRVHDAGLLHRDIKPGNIFISNDGVPMLIDFGSARFAFGEQTRSLSVVLSEGYAPPEQYTSQGEQGAFTDIYAIGAVLYELLTDKMPADALVRVHNTLNDDVDPVVPATVAAADRADKRLLQLIDQCMHLHSQLRPDSCETLLSQLDAIELAADSPMSKPDMAPRRKVKTRVMGEDERFVAGTQSTGKVSDKNRWIAVVAAIFVVAIVLLWQLGSWSSLTEQVVTTVDRPADHLPEPETEGSAILFVTSIPENASVVLNGKVIGKTPFQSDKLSPGPRTLQIIHPAMQDHKQNITLQDNVVVKRAVLLEPASGGYTILSEPAGALIYLNGKSTGKLTPSTFQDLVISEYEVTLKKDRYYPLDIRVQIEKNKILKGTFKLKGGNLVRYEGKWMEPQQRTSLLALVAAERDAELQRLELEEQQRLAEQQALIARKQAETEARERLRREEAQRLRELARKFEEERLQREREEAAKRALLRQQQEEKTRVLARKFEMERQRVEQQRLARLTSPMVSIRGGCFAMGSPQDDTRRYRDERQHRACVSDFSIAKYEVTQAQWDELMASQKKRKCPQCPVDQVSWQDAMNYIEKLNVSTGKKYRLPSEAEWEYACRAGAADDLYCGGSDLDKLAWHRGNSNKSAQPVGLKQANAFGLHDMSGNVWEWTCSLYSARYQGHQSKCAPAGMRGKRVGRGGSWGDTVRRLRPAVRGKEKASTRGVSIGFRLAHD